MYTTVTILLSLLVYLYSLLWGALSDWTGRKPVMLANLVIVGLSSFLFGFSVNFPMAVAMILSQGLGNSKKR